LACLTLDLLLIAMARSRRRVSEGGFGAGFASFGTRPGTAAEKKQIKRFSQEAEAQIGL
jgi:hypothetical protein